jgi:hypothetical protein
MTILSLRGGNFVRYYAVIFPPAFMAEKYKTSRLKNLFFKLVPPLSFSFLKKYDKPNGCECQFRGVFLCVGTQWGAKARAYIVD